jgi:hypothetical protein
MNFRETIPLNFMNYEKSHYTLDSISPNPLCFKALTKPTAMR